MENVMKKRNIDYHVMMLPGMIILIAFYFVPMLGCCMAFQDFIPAKGILGSKWIGFENFKYMFSLPDSRRIFVNTLAIACGKIIIGTLVPIIFALLLNEIRIKWFKRVSQTIVYLPHFLSWIVLAAVIRNLFAYDGPINQLMESLHMTPVLFLGSNQWFRPLLIGTDVWKEFGYNSVVYLAALTSIDTGLYEAASIDGANRFKQMIHITLPGILPIVLLMSAINVSNILNAGFDQIFNLYNPVVYETGDIIDTYVYRAGLFDMQFSFATAVGLLKSVVGCILLISCNQMAKKFTDQKIFEEVAGMIKSKTIGGKTADILIYLTVIFMTMCCLFPLLNMVAISFSDKAAASANMVGLVPVDFTTSAYKTLLGESQFWVSFWISIKRVFLGTIINMILTILLAYPLSKSKREFKGHDVYMYIVIFAMLFSGGMIPIYLTIKSYGLLNSIWALILPGAVPVFNVILLMNFFKGVPKSLEEAAAIDGASKLTILLKIYLPISMPALATIILFCIVNHWNDFFSGLVYMNKTSMYPLQTYIQQLSVDMSQITDPEQLKRFAQVSNKTLDAAKIVVSTIPLLIIYPFLQKYFVSGIVIGAVKE